MSLSSDEVWIPPAPRHASTVCLLRDGHDGVEVFVMRRKSSMKFAPRMYVFPGGAVESTDGDVPLAGSIDLARAAEQLYSDSPGAVIAAAARETFEECGVLIARGSDGRQASFDEDLKRDRADLVANNLSFTDLLTSRGLRVDDSALVSLAHWVTPENEPRRFDVRFFVAALPEGQFTYEVDEEADRTQWIGPMDALEAWNAGSLDMWIPTASTMRLLMNGDSAADVVENSRGRHIVPVRPHEVPAPNGELAWHLVHDRTMEVLEPMDPKDMASETAVVCRT